MNPLFKHQETMRIHVNHLKRHFTRHSNHSQTWHYRMPAWPAFPDIRELFPGIQNLMQTKAGIFAMDLIHAIRTAILRLFAPIIHVWTGTVKRIIRFLDSLIEDFYIFMDDFFMMGEEVLQSVSAGSNHSGNAGRRNIFDVRTGRIIAGPVNFHFETVPANFFSGRFKKPDAEKMHLKIRMHLKKTMMIFPWWRRFCAHRLFVSSPLNFPFKLPFKPKIAWLWSIPVQNPRKLLSILPRTSGYGDVYAAAG